MSGKDMCIPIHFPRTGKKYSHTLGNLWKLVSHIWELYLGFVITSNFIKNPQPGNDMSFHRIFLFYENLHIPIRWELLGFSLTLSMQGSKEYGKSCVFPYFSRTMEIHFPIFWELHGFLLHPKYLRNP